MRSGVEPPARMGRTPLKSREERPPVRSREILCEEGGGAPMKGGERSTPCRVGRSPREERRGAPYVEWEEPL